MKRDMVLIRSLLMCFESDGELPYPTADEDVVGEHLMLLFEAGLIRATRDGDTLFPDPWNEMKGTNGEQLFLYPLTWEGHDFVCAARDETVWNKIIGTAKNVSYSTFLNLLKAKAAEFAAKFAGLESFS